MPKSINRRRFLTATSLAGLGLGGYSLNRGLRFPMLGWEPAELDSTYDFGILGASSTNLIKTTQQSSIRAIGFRAYAPEPSLTLFPKEDQYLQVLVNNIASDAELITKHMALVKEEITGISRLLSLDLKRDQALPLRWQLPSLNDYSFASIGDTGGNHELAWCLQRAEELGARFLLHLGDFNYQDGDYDRSIELFNNSPIPCYVSIGNHDFNDNGRVYQQFLDGIGPFNNAFAIGKTRFANIDTAASFLPFSSGLRGQLFKELMATKDNFIDTVGFTHRPLYDPVPDSEHHVGNEGERNWLAGMLKKTHVPTLLSGHIHIYDRDTYKGIDNIIAGQGLGHQDLIVNQDYSKMVLGEVNQDGKVDYRAAPLAMPMTMHCHPRSDVVKESLVNAPHYDVIKEIDKACQKS